MGYIQTAMGISLMLGIYDMDMLWWYIDSSFCVNHFINSLTVIMMPMGQGGSISNLTKQKMNTNSLTRA